MNPFANCKFFLVVCLLVSSSICHAFPLEWARQLGTTADDSTWGQVGHAVSADGLGNVYVAGQTQGNLGGVNAGASDLFLGKYNSAGTLLWTTQLGTSDYDYSHGVAADSLGNNFVTGWTQGSLGGPNAGGTDAFVSKYDPSGSLQWTHQFGTTTEDRSFGLAADGLGNVFSVGWTFGSLAAPLFGSVNAFLYKFDAAGTELWATQASFSQFSSGYAVASDPLGDVFITGTSVFDAFISKYDSIGNLVWTQVFGSTQYDEGSALVADGLGNIYVAGETRGNLAATNLGFADAYLAKFNSAGVLVWSKQFGTTGSDDHARGLTIDSAGNIYLAGSTDGSLFGPNLGFYDDFLAKFDPAGNLLASAQIGTASGEANSSISFDPTGALYMAGITTGSFGGPAAGGNDVYLLKFSIPEPSTLMLFAVGLVILWERRFAGNSSRIS